MELYLLDSLLRRTEVVDKFESLIWTERFNEIGDFELNIKSTRETRSQFYTETLWACNTSMRVMKVEGVEDKIDQDGQQMLKVKGRSLECILEDRVAMNAITSPLWTITGIPGDVMRAMFDHICRTGALSLDDIIPFIQPGSIYPADTLPEPGVTITWEQKPEQLYKALKNLADIYDLGFRLVRNYDTSQLYFDVYAGDDRTTRQSVLPPVIFSIGYDNLQNTTQLDQSKDTKNVAYVYSDVGSRIVYGDGVDPDTTGFDRRVLLVEASDVTAETPDIQDALLQKGQQELAKNKSYSAFDGEVNQYSQYKYGRDYELGDIVEMRNVDGVITYKRVTEQIFVHDREGERAYPTVSTNMFVSSNTWLSQPTNKVWADFTTEFWVDM